MIDIHIHTIEENYEYRMKNIIKKFVKNTELEKLNAEELQTEIWTNYAEEFGQMILEDMYDFAGDKLFEIEG